MRTIGIGIIGWGFMGRTHARAIQSIPLFYPGAGFRPVLAGVCSRRMESALEAQRQCGAGFVTDDYRALLARPEVEVVSICTPNDQHERMALDAIAAGKQVYIDKPLAMNAAAAGRIAQAARRAGVHGQVALNNRFFPSTLRAKQLVEEGRIGRLLGFEARYLHSGSIDPDKPMGWKQQSFEGGGGVLLDLGSHALDLITFLAGPPQGGLMKMRTLYPERPTPSGGRSRAVGEDQALALIKIGDALGTLEASKIATGADDELTLCIRGDRGALRWNLMEPSYLEFLDATLPEAPLGGERGFTRIQCVARYPAPGGSYLPPKNAIGWDRAHTHCYFSFLDALYRGEEPRPSLEEGARLQGWLEGLYRSAQTGEWVTLS